jgi:cobalt-zinc-cadmium efflux system membrane fusion protein
MKDIPKGTLGGLSRVAPKAIVLLALLAVGLWGHRTGWKAPKLSSLLGRAQDGEVTEDWCAEHRVPRSKCVACNPSLIGADPNDWCREHGVPESRCSVCHPEILKGGVPRDWCTEHGVPESQCTLCHPEIAASRSAGTPAEDAAAKGPEIAVLPGREVPTPNPACTLHEVRVQFASEDALRKAGIELGVVEERSMPEVVTAAGETEYDGERYARIAARAAGTAWRVESELGDEVKRGDLLALVDSADAGRARTEILRAIVSVRAAEESLRRLETLADTGLKTQSELLGAQTTLAEARVRVLGAQQSLLNLGLPVELGALDGLSGEDLAAAVRFIGLPREVVAELEGETRTANLLPITSPLDGAVVSRDVVAGEAVDVERALFVVADVSGVWGMLDVRLEDAARLAVGQQVVFRPDGDAEHAAHGTLSWLSPEIDERTRTVRARADLENPEGRLRVHTFGSVRIRIRENPSAVAVPEEAVQWEGCCRVVFVREAPLLFRTRKVRLGARHAGFWEVLVGVLPGETVATRGSALLRSEILKSRLGAGCAGE